MKIKGDIVVLLNKIIDIIFPRFCVECLEYADSFWCSDCKKLWIYQPVQKCIVCKKVTESGRTHNHCKKYTEVDFFFRYGKYSKNIKKVLHFYKFERGKILASELAEFYFQIYINNEDIFQGIECIVPVPISYFRKLERGYNQVDLLARSLSKLVDLSILDIVRKKSFISRQSELDKSQRFRNIENAFYIPEKYLPQLPKNILLLDDVATSGATLNEVAKVLKKIGVQKIVAMTLVRN